MSDGAKRTPLVGTEYPTLHPPFDPDEFARQSESQFDIAPDSTIGAANLATRLDA